MILDHIYAPSPLAHLTSRQHTLKTTLQVLLKPTECRYCCSYMCVSVGPSIGAHKVIHTLNLKNDFFTFLSNINCQQLLSKW